MKRNLFYLGLFVLSFNFQLISGQTNQPGHTKMAKTSNVQQRLKRHNADNGKFKKGKYVEGEVLVKFRSDVNVPESVGQNDDQLRSAEANPLAQAFRELGVNKIKPISTPKKGVESRSGATKSNLYKLTFDTTVTSTKNAIEYLKHQDGVLIVEPNYKRRAYTTNITGESNPLFSQQWALNATNIKELWKVPTTTGKRPVIAIVDTGLDTEHEEFAGKIWVNEAEANGLPGVDDDGNGYIDDIHGYDMVWHDCAMSDSAGHGTHCAGIAAANDNLRGIIGMNPDAIIMPVRVLDAEGGGDEEGILEGVNYAVANGADIISLSLGGEGCSEIEKDIYKEASKHAIIVAAAGNEEDEINTGSISFPAGYPDVLAVASSDTSGNLSDFSNRDNDGPITSNFTTAGLEALNYELIAPGSSIVSTLPYGYGVYSGTSMACPCMAGIISRLLQCKEYNDRMTLKLDLINACKSGCIDAMKAYEGHTQKDFTATLLTMRYANKEGKEYNYEFIDFHNDDEDEEDEMDDDEFEDNKEDDDFMNFMPGDTVYAYPILVNFGESADNIKLKFNNLTGVTITPDSLIVDHVGTGDTIKVGPVIIAIDPENTDKEGPNDEGSNDEETSDEGSNDDISDDDIYDPESPFNYQKANYSVSVVVNNDTTTTQKSIPLCYDLEWDYENGIVTNGHTTTIYDYASLNESLYIPEGDTLIIESGISLFLEDNVELICDGKLICNTNKTLLTHIFCYNCAGISFKDTLERIMFRDLNFKKDGFKGGHFKNCSFASYYYDSDEKNRALNGLFAENCTFDYCQIESCEAEKLFSNCKFKNCTINHLTQKDTSEESVKYLPNLADMAYCNCYKNMFGDREFSVAFYSITPEFPSFLGSNVDSSVRQTIIDANHPTNPIGKGVLDISNMLDQFSSTAVPVVKEIYINGIAIDSTSLDGKFYCDENISFPQQTSYRIVFSGPVYRDNCYITNISDSKWESDTVLTGTIILDPEYPLAGGFRDTTNFFEINFEIPNINVDDNNDDGINIECQKGQNIKLSWNKVENADQYVGLNVYGVNFMYLGKETDFKLQEQIEPSRTSIELKTKHKYDAYCIRLEDKSGEEINIYNYAIETCKYNEDGTWSPEYCEETELNLEISLEVINLLNEVDNSMFAPSPLCFDKNDDGELNIQDFVYVYNTIVNDIDTTAAGGMEAEYSVEDNILYVKSDYPIEAVEAYFEADDDATFEAQSGLDNMEHFVHRLKNEEYQLLAYSFNKKKVPSGKQPLLKLNGVGELKKVLLSDKNGNAFTLNQTDFIDPTVGPKKEGDPAKLHYYDILGRKISPSSISNNKEVYIQAEESDGKLRNSKKIIIKK